jgi:tetratricopeptide (TPR) repeat protein
MALEMAPAVIHLKDSATGETVARLEDPHGDRARWQAFTPDGTRLVVACSYDCAIHIWDLRAIRERLTVMNLDWNWPQFPPAATGNLAAEPMTIHRDELTREQRSKRDIERYRREVEAAPNSAEACNQLAWELLTAPEPLRDAATALTLAERATRLEAGDAVYRNTLGVAYYRAGRYREAVAVLRPNLEREEDRYLAFDLYCLAMSHERLGERAQARDTYHWAVRWTQVQPRMSAVELEELSEFRAEAEKLLRIDAKDDKSSSIGRQRPDVPVP